MGLQGQRQRDGSLYTLKPAASVRAEAEELVGIKETCAPLDSGSGTRTSFECARMLETEALAANRRERFVLRDGCSVSSAAIAASVLAYRSLPLTSGCSPPSSDLCVRLQVRTASRQSYTQKIHTLRHGQRQSAPNQIHEGALAFLAQSAQRGLPLVMLTGFFHATFFQECPAQLCPACARPLVASDDVRQMGHPQAMAANSIFSARDRRLLKDFTP